MTAPTATTAPKRSAPIRFFEIDGMRGFGATMVILAHMNAKPLFWAWVFMDMFFVVSSLLITRIVIKQVVNLRGLLAFWGRRIERIWPLYLLTVWALLLLSLALSPANPDRAYQIEQFWRFFTFSQYSELLYTDSPMYRDIYFIRHLWSLAVEEQFYILLPILVLALRYLPRALWIVLLLATIPLAVHERLVNTHMVLISNHIDAFALGSLMALGMSWMEANKARVNWLLGVLFLAGLAGFLPYVFENYRASVAGLEIDKYEPWAATAGIYMAVAWISLLAINRNAQILAPLRWPPLVYLGVISYPLYLVHFPITSLFPKYLPALFAKLGLAQTPFLLVQAAMLFTSVLLAHILYKLIDQRLQAGRKA